MTQITELLFENQDIKYADFTAKLIPNIPRENFIGVRIPVLRKIAKDLKETTLSADFLKSLPHQYHDENMLHAILISDIKDYDRTLYELEKFLTFVDNWAVCDAIIPKAFKNNTDFLLEKIKEWISSEKIYTCRFGIKMLMTHFLDENFSPNLLSLPGNIKSSEYYINMMIAWFFQVALSKQWDFAIKWLENDKLSKDVQNKTIQKCKESFKITKEQKEYLNTLKRI